MIKNKSTKKLQLSSVSTTKLKGRLSRGKSPGVDLPHQVEAEDDVRDNQFLVLFLFFH